MNARFLHPSYGGHHGLASRDDEVMQAPRPVPLEPACCCPAPAVVRAVMPPTRARPHETELLLCGHHYRVSRQALAVANATVIELLARVARACRDNAMTTA